MAAFVGWLVATGNQVAIANGHDGIHFPGYCSQWQTGTTFADIAAAGGLIAGKIPGAIPVAPTGFFDGAAFVEPFGTFASYH